MNIFKLSDFSLMSIEEILKLAAEYKNSERNLNFNYGKTACNLFFEPSTRTHYSFDMAEKKLRLNVINFDSASSSLKKGESLYDTVKTFEMLGVDVVIIRATENEYYNKLVPSIKIPIINAGDGTGNHPSQSLLDLYTIKEEFGHFEGLNIIVVGDILHSRVAHSNIEVMERIGMNVFVSGPEEFREEGYNFKELDEFIPKADIVMLLRVQNERLETKMNISIEDYHKNYGLNLKRVNNMKEKSIIMHPAPFNRGVEIADEVVECPKSRIFKQIQNGVFVRMAMLDIALSK